MRKVRSENRQQFSQNTCEKQIHRNMLLFTSKHFLAENNGGLGLQAERKVLGFFLTDFSEN